MCQACGCSPCKVCGKPIKNRVCSGCGKPTKDCTCAAKKAGKQPKKKLSIIDK